MSLELYNLVVIGDEIKVMSMKGKIPLLLFAMVALTYVPIPSVSASLMEVDTTAVVYKVIDGDTFDAFPVGRVRLADINAPESGEPSYAEARSFLSLMVYDKRVYLDVDDIYVMDRYNRIVCLVYVRYNSTHLINVNLALLIKGFAVINDYYNEFNPTTWILFVYHPATALPETYEELLDAYLDLQSNYETLNATHYRLKSDHETLNTTYYRLESDYASLKASFEKLKADIDSLRGSYVKLETDYTSLQTSYTFVKSDYDFLKATYDKLKADYDSLKTTHDELTTDYHRLESDYGGLKLEHESTIGQLRTNTNLMYVFITATVAFAATTVYFAKRRPKI